MIFKIILSFRYGLEFKLLACLLVISLILSISGCKTIETLRTDSKNITSHKDYEIINVIMKNELKIDLKNKSARFVREYLGKKNLIFYSTRDTIRISEDTLNIFSKKRIADTAKDTTLSSTDSLMVFPTIKIIELDEVKWVTIKKTEVDVGKTILFVVAAITVIWLLYILLGGTKDEDKKDDKDYEPDNPDRSKPKKYNIVPNNPVKPSPPDSSLNIPRLVELSWKCTDPDAGDELRFDIYADFTNPPKVRVARNISSNKFDIGLIAPNTTMYWLVIAKDEYDAERRGKVWCFTTEN